MKTDRKKKKKQPDRDGGGRIPSRETAATGRDAPVTRALLARQHNAIICRRVGLRRRAVAPSTGSAYYVITRTAARNRGNRARNLPTMRSARCSFSATTRHCFPLQKSNLLPAVGVTSLSYAAVTARCVAVTAWTVSFFFFFLFFLFFSPPRRTDRSN